MSASILSRMLFRNTSRVGLVRHKCTVVAPMLRPHPKHTFSNTHRLVSTVQAQGNTEPGLLKKVLRKIPFLDTNHNKMMAVGYILYEEIADKLNYVTFFDELDLPDTFYSWFVITELHVWMVSVRTMAEGDDGRTVRNAMVEALWGDVSQRVKQLQVQNSTATKTQVIELSEQLQAAMIAYDEGLQSDDSVLAGALWRRFYQHHDVDPARLDLLVQYVRKQIRLFDSLPQPAFFSNKKIYWTALKSN